MDFTIDQQIVDGRNRLDELTNRHNELCALVPGAASIDEVVLLEAEVDKNMRELTFFMDELERLCARSPFFARAS
jgi:hypothetical protein